MSLVKFIAGFDLHGDRQDSATVKAFLDFDKLWKPKIRIFGGDLVDLRPLRKGASAEDRAESMRADIDAGVQFLNLWKPNYFIRGNHDERLWERAQSSDGVVADYAQRGVQDFEAICAKNKIKMLPYHKRDGVLRLGHLKVLHGFHCGIYAARQTALIYGSVLMGHTHTIDEHSIPGLDRRVARVCGALCQLSMDYNARQPNTLRQANGWAYGLLNEKTGDYLAFQAEKIGDKWLLPSEMTAIG